MFELLRQVPPEDLPDFCQAPRKKGYDSGEDTTNLVSSFCQAKTLSMAGDGP